MIYILLIGVTVLVMSRLNQLGNQVEAVHRNIEYRLSSGDEREQIIAASRAEREDRLQRTKFWKKFWYVAFQVTLWGGLGLFLILRNPH